MKPSAKRAFLLDNVFVRLKSLSLSVIKYKNTDIFTEYLNNVVEL